MTDYCTAAEVRTQINKTGTTGTASDAALGILITAASNMIDRKCNRPDGFVSSAVDSARVYPGSGKPYQWIDECTSITTLAVKDDPSDSTYTTWAATDYIKFTGDPEYPDFNSLPYTGLMIDPNGDYAIFTSGRYLSRAGFRPSSGYGRSVPTVQVTAKWGYATTCPGIIKEATIALVGRWFKKGEGTWMDTLSSNDLGQLQAQGMDSDILAMLKNNRMIRPAIGVRW